MIQKEFALKASEILSSDENVIGLAVGGSWLTDEIDDFSDVDLIIVTANRISGNKEKMVKYAERLGAFISGFTGEHVGEPRVLICLYANPLLHVDLKFLTLEEFSDRVETPAILFDTEGQLQDALQIQKDKFPYPDYQWIEDRFWTWIHYVLLKIGRGENMEAFDFFGFLRMVVFGPLLHVKNGNLPRGVRKVETTLEEEDLEALKATVTGYDRVNLLKSLKNSVLLYRQLRDVLFQKNIIRQERVEKEVMRYFDKIEAIQ